jgi:DNA-binding CsgD family transcriptional regulator
MLAQASADDAYPSDGSVAVAALDLIDRGIVVIDSGARIRIANDFARAIATRLDALSFLDGRLTFLAAHLEQEFERFRAIVRSWVPACSSAPHWIFSALRATGEPEYRISMRALQDTATAGEPCIFVSIHDPQASQRVDAQTLQHLYGLTPMQADIASALFEGLAVEQVSERLSISENTVRTHLKAVFKKCAVRSQAELLRLLALGPRGIFLHPDR